jgi:hypothetical protein
MQAVAEVGAGGAESEGSSWSSSFRRSIVLAAEPDQVQQAGEQVEESGGEEPALNKSVHDLSRLSALSAGDTLRIGDVSVNPNIQTPVVVFFCCIGRANRRLARRAGWAHGVPAFSVAPLAR